MHRRLSLVTTDSADNRETISGWEEYLLDRVSLVLAGTVGCTDNAR
jgi:hypothetical protein